MSLEHWILEVMSGRARGLGATTARAVLSLAEPAYASAAAARNRRFDKGDGVRRLPRPVISVGNVTTGGTGKTPAVQWLVRALQDRGHRPGVLLRGYRKSSADASSDEESLLRTSLNVPVVAHADRFRGGAEMLEKWPEVSVVVLDDGFQHRRLARDVDIVLIDATNPFGFGHVLPRGLLREPLAGLSRADMIWITRSNQAEAAQLASIESTIRAHNASAPISRTVHKPAALLIGDARHSIDTLAGAKVFALSGLGNPAAFERSLAEAGMEIVGGRRFGDHHAYTSADVTAVLAAARRAGASHVLTTEKDWVKLEALSEVRSAAVPFVRLAVEFEFTDSDPAQVLAKIGLKIEAPK